MVTFAASLVFVSSHLACNKSSQPLTDSLLPQEKQGLAFMREEEKMAFDVYDSLYARYGLMPFQNIRQSETNHMAAVKSLLDKYGLADPAAGNGPGRFTNTTIQQLYNMLIAKGDSSEVLALTAGALIEEVDIRDLHDQLALTQSADIRNVYDNLMRGSRNHLRAFVSNLASRGVTYVPQYLSREEFDAIINSPMEPGNRRNW